MKMASEDQKRVYQDYWKVYDQKVMMIFTVLVACTLFAANQHEKIMSTCAKNDFAKIELPNSENNFKKYKSGTKSLKMNTVIYADFESMLVPYSTYSKENATNEIITKQVPCGYSINVVNSHNNTIKQTYYCDDNAVTKFCKETCYCI